MKKKIANPHFSNKVIDKNQLKNLITWAFRNYGIARAANMADNLKDLGFYYATKAGISLSLEDLRIPPSKQNLLETTLNSITDTDNRYKKGEITVVERFQKVIDTWNYASETLKKQVVEYFRNTDPLNSIYMMAFSGARANISQVRQLVGMRGLMADPQGQIIDLPISSNFREGLTITDYFISSYGARKGLVDTALRTADSGYLTRRLVDVAQDVIIREYDCKTSQGILIEEMIDNQKILINLHQALVGRILAEDIFDTYSSTTVAYSQQYIDATLADKLVNLNLKKILVRSPLTCSSVRSVCQLCYGWNLAHGKMVDLGEAVGIIAAQSIGEPGTQLTMRTFHTGGVFTGELSQNVISPCDGLVKYPDNINFYHTRTRHGDAALFVSSDCKIQIINNNIQNSYVNLIKGSLLIIQNNCAIKKGDIVAEYPLSNRIITERAQKSVIADFSGSIHIRKAVNKRPSIYNDLSLEDNSKVVWILSGQVYNLPNNANLVVKTNQYVNENSLLAKIQMISNHNGRIYLNNKEDKVFNNKLLLVTSSKIFKDIKILLDSSDDFRQYILYINNIDKFLLKIEPNKKLFHNQIVADLMTDIYKTATGGIIKYLDLSVISQKDLNNKKDYYNISGSGYILWISEETHEINKDISLLLVKHGQFVEVGTEIVKNIFANNSGILEVVHKDGIIRELIIKPGKLHPVINYKKYQQINKSRGFLRPGENLLEEVKADKLVYWEFMLIEDKYFILVRPVLVYSVPNKNISFNISNKSFATDIVNLEFVRRTNFRDGERVKSITGVDLITTHLVIKINNTALNLNCSCQLEENSSHSKSLSLKFITCETLNIKDNNMIYDTNLYTKTNVLVKNGEYIKSGAIISQTEIFSSIAGKIEYIKQNSTSNARLLLVSKLDTRSFTITNNQILNVKVNDWVYTGDHIATNIITYDSGQIISIQDNQIILRIGQPYLISSGSVLHIDNDTLVQRGENIATIIFERAKTGDIVQGLPRIEEILEARKKSDNSFNPHFMLEAKFRFYLNQGLTLYNATRLSVVEIQLFLVKEIQLVYQSQGVDIADKHIEVIVRQMTSKVKIENGGDTDYLPGEIVELQKIELINKSISFIHKTPCSYHPILLGITKASLNTDSFISAASFQETTKVLTDAAISGKLDWLRGLKENVIIGRLIPAGTGFNTYNQSALINNQMNDIDEFKLNHAGDADKFEDIILDDRIARKYSV
uniref:DNA-directed RNA polymerase n=1 Tax=Campylaephora sungminbooi TaxID=1896769 RepID=A0A1B0TIA6_9FLOR|nr:RNA polymerase beta' subunit [Campylaephora sungminbooi]AKU47461.1 RNA polymerase beta' subunit [Campylaephora sungminbooi]ALN11908.1 RNA polymerase beta' subunit [Campylaephora sungminbooi]